MERLVWSYDSSTLNDIWQDEQIAVTITEDHVLISVTEEHAMDSYNEEFCNSIKLPFAQVRGLVAVLQSAVEAHNEKEHGTNELS